MLNLLHSLFELLLQLLDFLVLVIVLNSLVLNLLLYFLDLVSRALLVALPLFSELFEFFVDLADL